MTSKIYRATAAAVVLVGLAAQQSVADEPAYTGPVTERTKICMMQDSIQPREGIELKHDGKSYYFCCSMCETKFRESPDTYAHSTDPVSGKRVDKASAPIYAYRGKAFFFENQGSLEQFAKAPERYVSQSR